MQEKIRVIRIHPGEGVLVLASEPEPPVPPCPMAMACLLYTSDAADE